MPIRVLISVSAPSGRRCRAGRRAQGFQIVGRRGHRSRKVGLRRRRGRSASTRSCESASPTTRSGGIKAASPTSSCCARVVAEEGPAADRDRAEAKVPIVSTTEELSYPGRRNRTLRAADRRDGEEGEGRGARHRRQSRLRDGRAADHADRRSASASTASRVDRVQDARIRRLPFQQKIGAGLTHGAVPAKVDDGSVRHVGLAESIAMIADAHGLEARPDHRRDPAEDGRRARSRANCWRSIPATCAASSRTASATARARR